MEYQQESRLQTYLPGIYASSDFINGFLNLIDSFWYPLEQQLDQLYAYIDPSLAPSEFLPWLGTWVDLVLDENWPEPRRRQLIKNAADLYRRRGTAGGLRDYLATYMGFVPEIKEDETGKNPFMFTVTFRVTEQDKIDQARIKRIIEEEKPAHTTYILLVEKA